jgi:hypothetical protein
MSEAAEVTSGSEGMGEAVQLGTTVVDGMMGDASGSGEVTSLPDAPPEKTSTGIARPAWMAEGGKGTTESKQAATSGPTVPADGKKTDESQAKVEGDATAEGTEEKSGEESAAKPPAGYVPKEALSEARGEARYFKEQLTAREQVIANLQAQLNAKPAIETQAVKGEFDNFRALSDDEFEELADDDPVAASNYAKQLVKFERHQAEKADREAKQAERAKDLGIKVNVAKTRILEILPDDATNAKVAKFATEMGLSPDVFILTDPETQVLINGEPTPLNNIAANLVETLANLMNKSGSQNEMTVDMVPDAIKEAIIAQAQESILNKVKSPSSVKRSVSDLPSVNRSPDGRFAGKSYGQLSPAERQAYLAMQG